MSTKSALRADLDAEDRKTLAEDRKRMESSQLQNSPVTIGIAAAHDSQ